MKLSCAFCSYEACRDCVKRYILSTPESPHCMNCRKSFSRVMLSKMFSKSFLNNEFKKARENILFDSEKSMFQATQPYIEIEVHKKEILKKMNENNLARNMLRIELRKLQYIITLEVKRSEIELRKRIVLLDLSNEELQFEYDQILNGVNVSPETHHHFTHKCPRESCTGFLSKMWKCAVCSKYTCKDCHEPKNDGHECDPNTIETVKHLESHEYRKCPKCTMSIYKIEGCFAPDTPIFLWDGTTKNAQDIQINDILVGIDGSPRTVMKLISGESEMYQVFQNNGMTYTVNGKHTLVLKRGSSSDIHQILVEDFMKIPPSQQKNYMGFKSTGDRSGIQVNPVGQGFYYGWTLEESDDKFILPDFTVVKNCSQMFCVNCNTAFDWRTGNIVTGRIHNPHYYEYMSSRGNLDREIGDVQCGGLPPAHTIAGIVGWGSKLIAFHRHLTEFQELDARPIQEVDRFQMNLSDRVQFIMGNVSQEYFKTLIQQRDKVIQKKTDIGLVNTTFIQILSDIYGRITKKNVKEIEIEIVEACAYSNQLWIELGKAYSCIVPQARYDLTGIKKVKV